MYKPLQGISPYQHNIDIIKEFFKTPLIITTAIFVILSFTLNFFSEIFYCINNGYHWLLSTYLAVMVVWIILH